MCEVAYIDKYLHNSISQKIVNYLENKKKKLHCIHEHQQQRGGRGQRLWM